MTYTLTQILADKKLRGALAERKFTFEDTNGVFSLDFQDQSIRKNHRKAFDRLQELGGEELLAKLLAEGKTCLTDTSKQGVSPIHGTDRFYLKTNAGAPTALASIFFGIAGWAELAGDFDPEQVFCRLDEAEECEDDPDEESCDEDCDDCGDAPEKTGWWHGNTKWDNWNTLPKRNCSLAVKNGRSVFYDEDQKQFVTLFYRGQDGLCPLDDMYACEPLRYLDMEDEPILGYRYQLEEGGKWGFISPGFTQINAPSYDHVEAVHGIFGNGMVTAWIDLPDEKIDLFCSGSVTDAESMQTDIWLHQGHLAFRGIDSKYAPWSDATLEEKTGSSDDNTEDSFDGSSTVFYLPSMEHLSFGIFCRENTFNEEIWYVSYDKGMLTMSDEFGNKKGPLPACGLSLEACERALTAQPLDFDVVSCLKAPEDFLSPVGTYIIRKDGYWAVAELNVSQLPKIARLLTPFAFTKITVPEGECDNLVLVDLFGKKGIFDWQKDQYVIPCDYETIGVDMDSFVRFIVRRMGFVGTLDLYGNWVTPLHREEP